MQNLKIPNFSAIKSQRLTEKTHAALAYLLEHGDYAIDATIGNGYDTLLLAQCVGKNGCVIGFDIQQEALESTQQKLHQSNMLQQAALHLASHSAMLEYVPQNWKSKTKAIVFNLGYLPGNNSPKHITTKTESTLQALNVSLELLCIGGAISIILYPGHEEGKRELDAVLTWLAPLKSDSDYLIYHEIPSANGALSPSPQWVWIQRIAATHVC